MYIKVRRFSNLALACTKNLCDKCAAFNASENFHCFNMHYKLYVKLLPKRECPVSFP